MAGRYKKGDKVKFWSETCKKWVPAKVNVTDEHGKLKLNVKPNVWLSIEVQGERVRPREKKPAAAGEKENQGSVGGGVAAGQGAPTENTLRPGPEEERRDLT